MRLASSASGYLMLACIAATFVAKADNAFELGIERPGLVLAWAILADVWIFLGLAGVFALAEGAHRHAAWATRPVAAILTAYVALNTAYLIAAGEQGSWHAFLLLQKNFDDLEMVLEEAISPEAFAGTMTAILILIIIPIVVRRVLLKRAPERAPADAAERRVQASLPVAVVVLLMWALVPGPRSLEARVLGENSVARFIRTTLMVFDRGTFAGYEPNHLVDPGEAERWAKEGNRPNIVLIVLESTRYDHVSFSGDEAPASTPHIVALADDSFVAHRARAVVPHTTKSLFSMLCARFPTMQRGALEVVTNNPYQCLPEVLQDAGYETVFAQSAFGGFEQRPRLIDKFGYEAYRSWEELRGQRVGYLASSDVSLGKWFRRWLKNERTERPFFVTILTSATHHPYRLPTALRRRAHKRKLARRSPADRYARLVEDEDRVVDAVLDGLDAKGLRDNTLVVVVGDHGEGFGDHGVKQHDNNFYEEGLHVPFIINGPGIPKGDYHQNVSLVDLTPTLMNLLGLRISESAKPNLRGYDILSAEHPGDSQPRYFGCYSSWRCRGFVLGDQKVVYSPEEGTAWLFDLAADPEERDPQVLSSELESHLEGLHDVVNAHRTRKWTPKLDMFDGYGDWWCPEGRPRCMHPKAHKDKYRYTAPERERESSMHQGTVQKAEVD